jgi:hypothetical protein
VGGFGNSKEYPQLHMQATRVDSSGKPNPTVKFVQFDVNNVAGTHSFFLHIPPDRRLGSHGPFRSIIQEFKYTRADFPRSYAFPSIDDLFPWRE